MKHTSITRKIVSGVATLALIVSGGLIGQTSSQAAGLPTVRYVSPDFNAANETFASDDLGKYYAAGGRSFFKYVGAGSTITVTYLITSDGIAPAADKAVSFLVNAPYSGSKATWEIGGKAVGPTADATAGLTVTGKTDAAGKVSFTIKNTNTADSAMAIPASETQARATTGRLYGNMKLVIDGLTDMQQVVDLLTFDITKAPATTIGAVVAPTPTATPTPTPTVTAPATLPSMRLVSPAFGPSNSVDTTGDIAQYYSAKVRAYYTYIAAGTTLTLKYLVTSDGTKPLANREVTLQVNAPYSGSKAVSYTHLTLPTSDLV